MKTKKIFISCGEMSGDLHASYIVEEMRKKNKNTEFFGVVGDKSIKAGVKAINHIKNNDIMGFVEALKKSDLPVVNKKLVKKPAKKGTGKKPVGKKK